MMMRKVKMQIAGPFYRYSGYMCRGSKKWIVTTPQHQYVITNFIGRDGCVESTNLELLDESKTFMFVGNDKGFKNAIKCIKQLEEN